MIFDTIENAALYFSLHPHFAAAFKWLEENPHADEGRYDIVGDDCFVRIQTSAGKGRSTPQLEAHDQYLDIQITLEGEDEIGWKPRAHCSNVTREYSSEHDAVLWGEEPAFYFPLAPGYFTILFPEDAHAPLSGQGQLKKAVFKLRASP